mgnify:CR=1 FL=1
MIYHLILVDSALEIVPAEIQDHPSVIADAKRKKKEANSILLDTNYHHSAMGGLEEKKGRGRPDIVHFSLLCAQNTPLNKKHHSLQLAIHIARPREQIITINPDTRIPRSMNRFEGIIVKLLKEAGESEKPTQDKKLMQIEQKPLKEYIYGLKPVEIHLFTIKGGKCNFVPWIQENDKRDGNCVVLVGGFQKGHFPESISNLALPTRIHSLSEQSLDAWTVVARIIHLIELVKEK